MPKRSVLAIGAGIVLAAGLQGSASPPPPPGFIASFHWQGTQAGFGGLSSIEMRDATRFVALSDRGAYVEGVLSRDARGAIDGVTSGEMILLRADGAEPLATSRSDSEGMALAPDGSVYISFETATRVLRYPRLDGPAENLPQPPEFRRFPRNAGLEAVAVDAQGTVYAIPERTGPATGAGFFARYGGSDAEPPFPVFRYRNGVWDQPFDVPRAGSFLPVSADIGPDGRLYVLERAFQGMAGFASRVRRFAMGEALTEAQTVLESPPGLHDNLEGLSVWRDGAGDLRLTMVSDDNFRLFQRTEIVEYRVPD